MTSVTSSVDLSTGAEPHSPKPYSPKPKLDHSFAHGSNDGQKGMGLIMLT